MPILDNQSKLEATIEHDLRVRMQDLDDRLQRAEYAIYKTEKPDTRFERIYDQLSSLEANRKKDNKCSED